MRTMFSLGAALLAVACSGSAERAPFLDLDSGGSTGSAGNSARGGSSASEAGAAGKISAGAGAGAGGGTAGAAGAADMAGAAGGHAAGAPNAGGGGASQTPPEFPCPAIGDQTLHKNAVCVPTLEFPLVAEVPVFAGNAATLIGVTPDALTVAWSALGSFSVRFFVADRASSADAFGPAVQPMTGDDVVGMSPDGLRLVVLSQDGTRYGELLREERGFDFGEPVADAFSLINADALANGLVYADCVISADDRTLIYTARSSDDQEYPVRISVRTGGEPWPVGQAIQSCELQRHGDLVRHPTSLSADGRTLFFVDPDRRSARAAWRVDESAPFSFWQDLPGVGRTSVNAACSELYYSSVSANTPLLVGSGP